MGRWLLAGGALLLLIGTAPLVANPHERTGFAQEIPMRFDAAAMVFMLLGAALVVAGAWLAWRPMPDPDDNVP